MALTQIGVNDPQAVKLFSKLTLYEATKDSVIGKLTNKNPDKAVVQILEDLEKANGDTIRFDLLMEPVNDGVTGDAQLKGNEEEMSYYQDEVVIQKKRNAHKWTETSQQRTLHDFRMDAKNNLSKWMRKFLDSYMLRMLCGDTSLTHGGTGLAPDADHYLPSNGGTYSGVIATDEAALTNANLLTLDDIDFALELMQTMSPKVEPVDIDGQALYVAVVHPYSKTDLKLNIAGSSYTSWPEMQMYAQARGKDNPIFKNALGVYNGVLFMDSDRIYSPTTNVRRNLLLGKQAGVLAFGNANKRGSAMEFGKFPVSWREDVDDYGEQEGIAVGAMCGFKKVRFNSKDFATFVISSYAAAHAH